MTRISKFTGKSARENAKIQMAALLLFNEYPGHIWILAFCLPVLKRSLSFSVSQAMNDVFL
jgi:hypothetical protein